MQSGYAYEFSPFPENEGKLDWSRSSDENWDITVYAPTGLEQVVGTRRIDGSQVRVYLCPDGMYRAQLASGRPV